jgi:hypothetical protein
MYHSALVPAAGVTCGVAASGHVAAELPAEPAHIVLLLLQLHLQAVPNSILLHLPVLSRE